MKYLLIIYSSIFFYQTSHGQLNEKFIDSIFQSMILEEIHIYDEHLNLISFEKEIWKELIHIDTVVSDQWTRPRFSNNIFQNEIDGVIIKSKLEIDSITYISDPKYVQFTKREFDKYGNFKFWKTLFLIKRTELKKEKPNPSKVSFPDEIISRKNQYWANKLIKIDGKKIQLDSCHFLYQLKLNEDFSFSQSFSNRSKICFTKEMENNIEVGTEGDSDLKYFHLLQGHYINLSFGIWKIKNNYLYLFSIEKRDCMRFIIQSITEKELVLKIPIANSFIQLKKVLD